MRQYLTLLRQKERDNPKIAQVKALLDLIDKWQRKLTRKDAYGLTAARAMELEAGLR